MKAINPLLLLCEELIARNDMLEGRVIDLEQALQLDKTVNVMAALEMPETLAQLLIMLADGKPRNRERLHAGLFYRRHDGEAPDIKGMDSLILKLRKHVEPYGVKIKTIFGNGYRLTAGMELVQAAMECGSLDDHLHRDASRQRKRPASGGADASDRKLRADHDAS